MEGSEMPAAVMGGVAALCRPERTCWADIWSLGFGELVKNCVRRLPLDVDCRLSATLSVAGMLEEELVKGMVIRGMSEDSSSGAMRRT